MAVEQHPGSASEQPLGEQVFRSFTGVLGVVMILCIAALLNPSWGQWTRLAVLPLVACALLFIMVVGARVAIRLRSARTQRLAAGLAPLFGQSWNPKEDMKASRFRKGQPRLLRIDYPDTINDRDPEWRARVEQMAAHRMGARKVTMRWDDRRGRVRIEAQQETVHENPKEQARESAEQRVHDILRPMFGTDITVEITEWETENEGTAA